MRNGDSGIKYSSGKEKITRPMWTVTAAYTSMSVVTGEKSSEDIDKKKKDIDSGSGVMHSNDDSRRKWGVSRAVHF